MRRIVDTSDPVNWSHPLNRGLVSWWLALPDQQRGVMCRDLCRRNNGTLTSGPTWEGSFGARGSFGSLSLTSTTYVTTSLAIPVGPVTVATYLTRDASPLGFSAYWEFYFDTQNYIGLWDYSTFGAFGVSARLANVTTININTGAQSIRNDEHVAVVFDDMGSIDANADVRLYYEGSLKATDTAIGGNYVATGATFALCTPAARRQRYKHHSTSVWNRVLSSEELVQHSIFCRQGYPGLLNRLPRRRYAPEQAVAAGSILPQMQYHGLYVGSHA